MYRGINKRLQNKPDIKIYHHECNHCNEYKIVYKDEDYESDILVLICDKCKRSRENKIKDTVYNGFYCNNCNEYGIMHIDEEYNGDNLVLICDKCEEFRKK